MIVADASVVVDLLFADNETRAPIEDAIVVGAPLEAPDLITLEVLSAIVGIARRRRLTRYEVADLVTAYRRLPITSHLTYPYADRIAALSVRHSVYDASYVALAEALGVPLLTTDRRLARSVHGVDVVSV
ncbi:type II toxin-antitoxin system VapC family toxin [Gaiella sp.]|uniref:type II toxin-antitoxin system VapC family toxin n=1 Tax=Gaiella sp. TaxID=2663207 RepID=UPI002E35D38D|nr:type II toxin-antitoxin system VapC family toxin [Gaiella sp.]HEX5584785.1 type II toxin-antitoxin system VapC family toxin [Gaiella sp.]